MGGPGSGYPLEWPRKQTVEQSLHLDTAWLDLNRLVGKRRAGDVAWTDPRTNVKMAGVDVLLDLRDLHRPAAWLGFKIGGTGATRNQKIPLVSIRPFFGGRRWYFLCPLCGEEGQIPLRVRKLYLPFDGGAAFGCRRCHDLSYDSCQDSHRFDRLFRDIVQEVLGTDSELMARTTMRGLLSRAR